MTVTSDAETPTKKQVAGWLTPGEFSILETVCDTLLPSLEPPAGSSEVVAAYYRQCARDLNIAQLVAETLSLENEQAKAQFRQLLGLLSNAAAGMILAGSPRPFKTLPQEKREKYLTAMANSPVGQLRQGYQAIKRLATFIYFSVPTERSVWTGFASLALSTAGSIHFSVPTEQGVNP